MKNQTPASTSSRASGKRIPDKPRDCGPHVDTWPILDTPVDDAPRRRTDRRSRPAGGEAIPKP